MNMKKRYIGAMTLVIAGLLISSTALAVTSDQTNQPVEIRPIVLEDYVAYDVSLKDKIDRVTYTQSMMETLGTDFPVFSLGEDDAQNPGIATDGAGAILVLTEDVVDLFTTSLWGRWSPDGGENWADEGDITGWQFTDNIGKPKLDHMEGLNSWGTIVPGASLEGDMHYIDFPSMLDPTVSSPISPDGWSAWHVDWGAAYGFTFDSADIAAYPYVEGTSPSDQFFGLVGATGYRPETSVPEEDHSMMFSFFTSDGQVTIISFYNMANDVYKISNDIDKSLGQYYWVTEYIAEADPTNNGSYFVKAPAFQPGDDWWQGSFPGFEFEGVHNPDLVAGGGNVYIVGETSSEGNKDIVCLYSTNAGGSFQQSMVTSDVDDEQFPTIAINDDELICTYVRNGDLIIAKSTDNGASWTEETEAANDVAGTVVEQIATAAVDGPYAAWTDSRNGVYEIYFDLTSVPPAVPILEISGISGPIGVKATISNTGDAAATDVQWTIHVTGGILGRIDKSDTQTISSIAAGSSQEVKLGLILGLGSITVDVDATCAEGATASESVSGRQLLIFTLL